jgi:PTH1 family peptidyl-tRNA hydrolase
MRYNGFMKLIVGLGNPGTKYEKTRHNAGFKAVEFLAEHFELDPFKEVSKHKAQLSEGQIEDEKVILAKPQTFMNLSGQTVRSLLQFYKLELSDLIVIYDDVAIGSGSVRIRPDGSAGGHNGIKSLIQELGSSEFLRVRLGIAPLVPFQGDLEDYVLGRLSEEEAVMLTGNLKKLPEIISFLLEDEVEKAMHEYN